MATANKFSEDSRPQQSGPLASYDDLWRVRVGDYRIVYVIEGNRLIVLVVRVAHRREAYRTR